MLTPQIQIVSKHEFPTLSTETTTENIAIHSATDSVGESLRRATGRQCSKKGMMRVGVTTLSVSIELISMLIMTSRSNGKGSSGQVESNDS
jgi:hypothetical protein